MKTATKTTITLQDFQVLRLNFLKDRLEFYAKDQDLTWEEVEEKSLANKDFFKEVDRVVPEHLHSGLTPQESDFEII